MEEGGVVLLKTLPCLQGFFIFRRNIRKCDNSD